MSGPLPLGRAGRFVMGCVYVGTPVALGYALLKQFTEVRATCSRAALGADSASCRDASRQPRITNDTEPKVAEFQKRVQRATYWGAPANTSPPAVPPPMAGAPLPQ
jgi:hypothetical protein